MASAASGIRRASEATAEEVQQWLPAIPQSKRHVARMLIVWTMDAMVRAGKIASHRLTGITVDRGQPARARRLADIDDDDESLGFTFISDAQVAALAGGCAVTRRSARTGRQYTVQLKGVGIAAWLQRTMGLRIRGPGRGEGRLPGEQEDRAALPAAAQPVPGGR